MPPHLSADRPAAQPPGRGTVDALITQTRRLRGDMDAVRQDVPGDGTDPRDRWQRALCDLALHQLDDLDEHLAQLRDGPAAPAAGPPAAGSATGGAAGAAALLGRVGSAEWNLLTDEASWSGELYEILGRDPATAPLTLDELPSLVPDEDRPLLTAMVTDCLVDARRIDGEFRVVRPDGEVRTVHMMGEPVLGADGGTASMWAVLRDVSALRRSRQAVRETRDSLYDHRRRAQSEHRLAAELQEAVLPSWRGTPRLPHQGSGTLPSALSPARSALPPALDLAAHRIPPAAGTPLGGGWYDTLELSDGETLLGVGDLTGQGVAAASGIAMLLGAVRGMAMAGTGPGLLLSWLNQLLDATAEPALGSAVCGRYRPATRTLVWAQAGHPAPLLFRGGTGRRLPAPGGAVPLGATAHTAYAETETALEPGDVLLLHTAALVPGDDETATRRLLDLAPRLTAAHTARDCLRLVVAELDAAAHEDDTCVLAARVTR